MLGLWLQPHMQRARHRIQVLSKCQASISSPCGMSPTPRTCPFPEKESTGFLRASLSQVFLQPKRQAPCVLQHHPVLSPRQALGSEMGKAGNETTKAWSLSSRNP